MQKTIGRKYGFSLLIDLKSMKNISDNARYSHTSNGKLSFLVVQYVDDSFQTKS